MLTNYIRGDPGRLDIMHYVETLRALCPTYTRFRALRAANLRYRLLRLPVGESQTQDEPVFVAEFDADMDLVAGIDQRILLSEEEMRETFESPFRCFGKTE